MTYNLKAIFPFSGILALETISCDISTFHTSRDLCTFFHCSKSNVKLGFHFNQEKNQGKNKQTNKQQKTNPNLLKIKPCLQKTSPPTHFGDNDDNIMATTEANAHLDFILSRHGSKHWIYFKII